MKAHVDALISLTAKIMFVLYKLVKKISWLMSESFITFWTNNIRNISVLKQSLWYIISENLLSNNKDFAKKKWLILMKETLDCQKIFQ